VKTRFSAIIQFIFKRLDSSVIYDIVAAHYINQKTAMVNTTIDNKTRRSRKAFILCIKLGNGHCITMRYLFGLISQIPGLHYGFFSVSLFFQFSVSVISFRLSFSVLGLLSVS